MTLYWFGADQSSDPIRFTATRVLSSRWRLAGMAERWRPAAATRPCGFGT